MMTPREAALKVYRHKRNDKQPSMIYVEWLEGKYIPVGTFNEFVHEAKGMGLCIISFRPGKSVQLAGC